MPRIFFLDAGLMFQNWMNSGTELSAYHILFLLGMIASSVPSTASTATTTPFLTTTHWEGLSFPATCDGSHLLNAPSELADLSFLRGAWRGGLSLPATCSGHQI